MKVCHPGCELRLTGVFYALIQDILKTDLIKRGYNLNNINDLHILRDVASDRVHWQSIFDDTA